MSLSYEQCKQISDCKFGIECQNIYQVEHCRPPCHAAIRAKLEKLIEYAEHTRACRKDMVKNPGARSDKWVTYEPNVCTCGLDDTLAAIAPTVKAQSRDTIRKVEEAHKQAADSKLVFKDDKTIPEKHKCVRPNIAPLCSDCDIPDGCTEYHKPQPADEQINEMLASDAPVSKLISQHAVYGGPTTEKNEDDDLKFKSDDHEHSLEDVMDNAKQAPKPE